MQAFLDTAPEKGSVRRNEWSGGEPPIGALFYLVAPFYELGPVISTGSGLRPIDWQDINAWQQATKTELKPWESKAMIDLSTAYIVQHHNAKSAECVSPFVGEIDHHALAAKRRGRRK